MSDSLEVIACETVLHGLLQRMANGPDPWDLVECSTSRFRSTPAVITFQDVENARAVSKLWKREIDGSSEYACLRLAKWDYDTYPGQHWTSKKEYESCSFNENWKIFKSSWSLARPINDDRLERASLGELSCCELDRLRLFLREYRVNFLWFQPGEKVVPAPDIWVSPMHRSF